MIPSRYGPVLFPLVMTFFMAGAVSLLLTVVNLGLPPDFLLRWLANWALAWIFAFPSALLAIPMARRIVGWLTAVRG
ncbi:DUF2798 domain-containing protein [Belnapia rosea]|uniref:DUF2798 domain-containing protein n=1 Tax=Belnapia rosea TaxID=938405 RepID=A0A1G6PXK4_9PROT|nr:DUF2798 domain-containing protein [Belnapia rosea]SDB57824.1 Protein of unknown function [Belnapia rosea]SDC84701.1 Protein of unknown function [Belnapia rosea]